MLLRWLGDELEVSAPAKLNLFLEILGRRVDGYHELETLMVPVSLSDSLRVASTNDGQLSLDCDWAAGYRAALTAPALLPPPTENLVYRAVLRLRERWGNSALGLRMNLVKRIPSEAGLGGASSDAAAALVAACAAWKLNVSQSDLALLAAEIGSDVPFFLAGGPAICRGRGEQIERVRGLPMLAVVIVKPPVGLSTAAVYRQYRPKEQTRSVVPLVESLRSRKPLGKALYNALESPARELSPWIGRLAGEMKKLNMQTHQMSGSGTSYFAICRGLRQARQVAAALRSRRCGSVFFTTTVNASTA